MLWWTYRYRRTFDKAHPNVSVESRDHISTSLTSLATSPNPFSNNTGQHKLVCLPTSETFIQGIRLNQLYTHQTTLHGEFNFLLSKNRRTHLQHSDQLEHKLLQYNNVGQDVVQTGRPLAAFLLSIKADLLH